MTNRKRRRTNRHLAPNAKKPIAHRHLGGKGNAINHVPINLGAREKAHVLPAKEMAPVRVRSVMAKAGHSHLDLDARVISAVPKAPMARGVAQKVREVQDLVQGSIRRMILKWPRL
jgi:hypothetical protein